MFLDGADGGACRQRIGHLAHDPVDRGVSGRTQQFEQVGITWYAGGKPVFKLVKELIDGDVYIIPGKCPVADEPVRLRLTVDGAHWKAEYKPESAEAFATAAEGDLPAPDGDQVSLQCYNGPEDAEHWVRFEDFAIRQLG